jgi:hypothetical protein
MSKIIGNTTATPVPRSDWNQTDETKVDFIKNKPDIATKDYVTDQLESKSDSNHTHSDIDEKIAENASAINAFAEITSEEITALFA